MTPPKRQPKIPAGPYGFIRKTNYGEGLSKIKKHIRDVERTLKKGARTAAAKFEAERRLRSLQLQYSEKYIDNHERTIAQRYRKIKHVELKKATRKVKRAEKELEAANNEEDKKMLQEKLEQCQLELMYIEYYPKTMAYISLYVTDEPKSAEKNELVAQGKIAEILSVDDETGAASAAGDLQKEQEEETAEDEKDDFFE
ncbi:hypothetical protein BX666DRAFT_1432341 [Dichotomocladium elegans]|nr:hypothetical protein BX666DRAFT_1432341 [Dichotomocladium elegans]